ncbi:MAG: TIGR00269 family protein [Candidatus Diapherotrites archaeon]|nr:TIGR00269 family protein [Candidatus Diapherotrites archaeon]
MTAGCAYSKLFGLEKGVVKGDKCLKCGSKAEILLPYGPQKFCEKHFLELIEHRFKKTIRAYSLVKKGDKIAVGYSGGKDSTLALLLLKKFFSETNPITAILIDEGIPGYRNEALKVAKKNCKAWKIPFKEFSLKKEFGFTMKQIAALLEKHPELNLGSPCTFCGTLRRSILNRAARQLKADSLATGHNLDDETQSILMNVCDNDWRRFPRSGAKTGLIERKGFVQRIKPLCEIPEREVFYYIQFAGLESYTGECCPFSEEAKRNDYRALLNQLEEKYPGTKYSLWQFYNRLKPKLAESELAAKLRVKINKCKKCGEPSAGEKCEACAKIEMLKKLGKAKR